MTHSSIAGQRLVNQRITSSTLTTPADLATWFGAMQAQDYRAAQWAIGLRLPGSTDETIEQALADTLIVRTWAMRGTLHVIAAADVRWMLALLRPRLHKISTAYCRKAGLDELTLAQSQALMTNALQGRKQLTRPELVAFLNRQGMLIRDQQLNFILVQAAVDGLICCGCRRGKQLTYTLLDEWIPAAKTLSREEALTELTSRYFTSHGPATLVDFVWWSGLTVKEAKDGLELCKNTLVSDVMDGQPYWMTPLLNNPSESLPTVRLLPSFDEYLVAYKDRRAALGTLDFRQIVSAGNGIFSPVIVADGQVVGTWKRTVKKNQVLVDTSLFFTLSQEQQMGLDVEISRFRSFCREPLTENSD